MKGIIALSFIKAILILFQINYAKSQNYQNTFQQQPSFKWAFAQSYSWKMYPNANSNDAYGQLLSSASKGVNNQHNTNTVLSNMGQQTHGLNSYQQPYQNMFPFPINIGQHISPNPNNIYNVPGDQSADHSNLVGVLSEGSNNPINFNNQQPRVGSSSNTGPRYDNSNAKLQNNQQFNSHTNLQSQSYPNTNPLNPVHSQNYYDPNGDGQNSVYNNNQYPQYNRNAQTIGYIPNNQPNINNNHQHLQNYVADQNNNRNTAPNPKNIDSNSNVPSGIASQKIPTHLPMISIDQNRNYVNPNSNSNSNVQQNNPLSENEIHQIATQVLHQLKPNQQLSRDEMEAIIRQIYNSIRNQKLIESQSEPNIHSNFLKSDSLGVNKFSVKNYPSPTNSCNHCDNNPQVALAYTNTDGTLAYTSM